MAKFRNITKEQAQAKHQYFNSEAFDFNTSHDAFNEEFSYHDEPSHHAKMMTSHAKKHLQHVWNQFVAFEEAQGEIMAGLHAGETLGQQTGIEQLEAFHGWLGGVLEAYQDMEAKESQPEEAETKAEYIV